jgi:hypothetical protein
MQPVNLITELGEHIMYFTGRTLDEALKAAQDWARVRRVTMGRYYQQPPFGGSRTVSILADYS